MSFSNDFFARPHQLQAEAELELPDFELRDESQASERTAFECFLCERDGSMLARVAWGTACAEGKWLF